MIKSPKVRLAYLDNLKALMIIFVVIVHAAVTYSWVGSFYYKEPDVLTNFSFYTFLFFQSFTQSYFMGLLFMISGSFVPSSLEKKGAKTFMKDRIVRLGIPTLIYIFLLYPICIWMVNPQFSFTEWMGKYFDGIISFRFLGWTGPLWFAVALIIFSIFYVLVKKWNDKLLRFSYLITTKNVFILIFLITLPTFMIRLFFPEGRSVMNFQLANFTTYIILFLLGIIAYQKELFDKITYPTAKKWLIWAFGLGVPIWIFLIYFGVTRNPDKIGMSFSGTGGLNWLSLLNAFWESFFCVAIILAFMGIFKERFNRQNDFQKFLSENSFGVYVFHTPILTAISLLCKNISIAPLGKWLLVSAIVLPLTFIFTSLIRSIPIFRKIFS